MRRSLLLTISASICLASTLSAQTSESSLTLFHPDSTMTLTLNAHSLVMKFTDRGVEAQRERVDSASTTYANTWIGTIVRQSVVGAFRGLHMEFPLNKIDSVETRGATVVVYFPPTTSPSDNTISFDAISADDAREFAARVRARMRGES